MSISNLPPGGPGEPEYLDQSGGEPLDTSGGSGGGRRTALVAGASVVALAAVGAGAWAAVSFFGAGDQPAEALPAGTLAYASIDLDPSGSQKIEAVRMLNKFPAFEEELGLDADDDIRRRLFEEAGCEGMSYDDDIAPWVGTSFAVAAVDAGEEQPSPVAVVELSDATAAQDGLATLKKCADDDMGWAIDGSWALVAETDGIARQVADANDDGTLADDSDYQKWMGEVGDPGVVSMYASPDVGPLLSDLMEADLSAMDPMVDETAPGAAEQMTAVMADFGGAAGVVRFSDGGMEAEFAADLPDGYPMTMPVGEGPLDVADSLPADTAVAYGAALPDGWAQALIDGMEAYGFSEEEIESGLSELESETGLTLPQDLETLLGQQFVLALGSDFDLEEAFSSSDLSGIPLGIKVKGDPEGVNGVIDKLAQASGTPEMFETETSGDQVAWSLSPDYRSTLAEGGSLGDSAVYRGVVAESDRAASVMFVNFDAGDWLTSLAEADPEAEENLEPLSAFGVSSWLEDGTRHGVARLTTN